VTARLCPLNYRGAVVESWSQLLAMPKHDLGQMKL
ncbi:MAG: hypothetical protein ACI9YE_001672, partial [Psychroserpens sp.]